MPLFSQDVRELDLINNLVSPEFGKRGQPQEAAQHLTDNFLIKNIPFKFTVPELAFFFSFFLFFFAAPGAAGQLPFLGEQVVHDAVYQVQMLV